jgi:tight adherence protein C
MPTPDPRMLLNLVAGLLIGGGLLAGLAFLAREASMVHRRGARLRGEQAAPPRPSASLVETAKAQVLHGAGHIGELMAIRDPAQVTILRQRLIQAGFNSRQAVAVYLGIRFALLALAVVVAAIMLPWMMLTGGKTLSTVLVLVMAALAVLGPDQVIRMFRRRRELEYREGFPDVLDLLVASVEAGLSLDAAVSRVADEVSRRYPRLGDHLRFLTLELRAGRPRREAWQNLADRLGLDEARSFATMLRQAETMGTSIGETLTVFSAEMRSKRMLRAEEKAMALPAKLVVPMILFIFPCLLAALVLPAGFRVAQTLGGM